MKYKSVIGVGCYGKPETLSRVLKKMVEKYIMGSCEKPGRKDGPHCVPLETLKLLKTLIGGVLENRQFSEHEIIENIKASGISGFFLAAEKHRWNLSIFTRDGQPASSPNLEGQTRIKRTHLH